MNQNLTYLPIYFLFFGSIYNILHGAQKLKVSRASKAAIKAAAAAKEKAQTQAQAQRQFDSSSKRSSKRSTLFVIPQTPESNASNLNSSSSSISEFGSNWTGVISNRTQLDSE
jgi:hypothetical protein